MIEYKFQKRWYSLFFFNDTATTEIYTLSLHDALPIFLTLSEILNEVSTVNPAPHYGEFGDNEAGSDFIFMAK